MPQRVEKQQNTGGIPATPFRFFFHASKPVRLAAIAGIVFVVLGESLSQASFLLFKWIIDAAENGDMENVILFGIAYPMVLYLIQLLWRFSGLMGMRWSTGTRAHASKLLTEYTMRHSHTFFSNRFAGGLLSNVSNVGDSLGHFVENFLWTYLSMMVSLISVLVLLTHVDVWVGISFFVFLVLLVVVNISFIPKKRRLSETSAAAGTTLRGYTVDVFTNIAAVRQFATRGKEVNALHGHIERHRLMRRMNWGYSEFMLFMNSSLLFVASGVILYFVITGWRIGEVTTGEFVLVLSLIANLSGTIIFLASAFNGTAEAYGEMEEGLKALIVPHEIVDARDAQTLIPKGGAIDWKEVSFKYGDASVFEDFSLSILKGQRVGLVGQSGAGKSTFVSLLLRQHDVANGVIEIDGQNISTVTQDSLREVIAVVPQDPLLFHRSIRENIAYGKPNATDEEVERAAGMAQIHDFIRTLQDGYGTLVGERGVKLSGGQRQRIAIARAMLKDAPILILDEATSSLDSESEVAIQKALRVLMEGKTVIAIAHRLSTLREMDRIIVLEKGAIVEDGTHEELLKKEGLYARLWAHQAGGFIQEDEPASESDASA